MRGFVCLVVAVLLPLAAAAPATACPRDAKLVLTISPGDTTAGSPETVARLSCFPAGGDHPHPYAACRALAAAHGDLRRLRPERGICPMIAQPVTVTARGHWFGRSVHYRRAFANRCLAAHGTQGVFAF